MENGYLKSLALVVAILFFGCGKRGGETSNVESELCYAPGASLRASSEASGPEKKWFVTTADHFYSSGNLQAVDPTTGNVVPKKVPVSADALVRAPKNSPYVFVINRANGDNIQVVDKSRLETVTQFSTGKNSNPQDIQVYEDKMFISRHNEKSLLICNLSPVEFWREVDLSAYADADGFAEPSMMLLHEGSLYLQLQRLDSDNFYTPAERSLVLKIDVNSGEVVASYELSAKNANTDFQVSREGKIYVSAMGEWDKQDGSVEVLGGEPILDERTLGGDIVDFEILDEELFVLVSRKSQSTGLVRANLGGDVLSEKTIDKPFYESWSAITKGENGVLGIADRSQNDFGFRLFDARRFEFFRNITLNLPPYAVAY